MILFISMLKNRATLLHFFTVFIRKKITIYQHKNSHVSNCQKWQKNDKNKKMQKNAHKKLQLFDIKVAKSLKNSQNGKMVFFVFFLIEGHSNKHD